MSLHLRAHHNATALRKASRRVTQLYDDALQSRGLRSTQFAILVELNRQGNEPPTVAQLAAKLVVDRSRALSVARTIAREHGGDITLANRDDGGLRVRMELPAQLP